MAENENRIKRVLTRTDLRDGGLTDRQIDRRLESGGLVAARRGILTSRRPAQRRVPVRVEAALVANRSRDLVASHGTAAQIHGCPKPLSGWGDLTFTSTTGTTRKRDGVVIRVAPLHQDEVVLVDGINVTGPTRTVADCFRTLRPRDALAIADDACHRGLVTPESVLACLATVESRIVV